MSNWACEACIRLNPDSGPRRNQRERSNTKIRRFWEREDRRSQGIIIWSDARDAGLKRYFTGKPCKRGHISERLVSNQGCLACSAEKRAKHRRERPEIWQRSQAIWAAANPDRIREYRRRSGQKLQRKLATALRIRLIEALQGKFSEISAIRDLGCSIDRLIRRFERLFTNAMTWENWGEVWQIDHIKPFSAFDLTQPADVRMVCHYTNLRPILIAAHKRKSRLELTESARRRKARQCAITPSKRLARNGT